MQCGPPAAGESIIRITSPAISLVAVTLAGTSGGGVDRRRLYVEIERPLARRHELLREPDERQSHDPRDVGDLVDARQVDAEAIAARQQRVVRERERVRRQRELDRRRVRLRFAFGPSSTE